MRLWISFSLITHAGPTQDTLLNGFISAVDERPWPVGCKHACCSSSLLGEVQVYRNQGGVRWAVAGAVIFGWPAMVLAVARGSPDLGLCSSSEGLYSRVFALGSLMALMAL